MRALLRNTSLRAFRVWQRDFEVYLTNWKTEFLPPLSEPILYVFAFGFGLGSLIHEVRYEGRDLTYLRFMAPGIVAVAIMFWSYFETTYSSFVRMYYQRTFDAILAMKREGVSIVVSEQNLHFARLISDRAYIIERGKICFGGTMAELDARPDIRDAHLSL